jgi:glycosyltransferase involved in cell wall biosynthesis
MRSFLRAGGRAFASHLIYDAEAVFAEREIVRCALTGQALSATAAAKLRQEEMALAHAADSVLAVSAAEAELFRAGGCADVRVLGHALTLAPTPADHAARQDLLFVGALHEDPSPNVDGLLWFVSEVMPRLDAMIGTGWCLHVVGRAEAGRVQALAGPRIHLLGRVADLTPLYNASRVAIAPMRYAGGIPHKVHEAAAHGLPVVTTPLLARQLGWTHEAELLAADTPDGFAQGCERLFHDAALWAQLREGALAALRRDCDESAFTQTVAALLSA